MNLTGKKMIIITRDYDNKTFDVKFEGHFGAGELRGLLMKVPKALMRHKREYLKQLEEAKLSSSESKEDLTPPKKETESKLKPIMRKGN